MNPIFRQIIIQTVWRYLKKVRPNNHVSRYDVAKEFLKLKVTATHLLKDTLLISIGIVSAGFGLKGFLLPNNFIDGGVTGISLLTTEVTNFSLPILIVILNIPFIILGFTQISKSFAIKSFLAIIGLAVVVATVNYPTITSDKLLVAAFGGFFLGAGIGLSIRGGGVLDGTEVLAINLSKRTGLTIGDIILIFNIIIFSVAAYLLSIESALYSILTYFAASKTVDFIVEGVEEYTGVTIISYKSEEIRQMIIDKMGRGVTIYSGKKGYGKHGENLSQIDIVYTVITRLEIAKLQTEIDKLDTSAFIVMSSIKDTKGGMIKKRPLK
ncbi:MAG: YitT family protein [Bacteroidota bacterium]|nr:YitT family protein [Bacteroidota bacterium]